MVHWEADDLGVIKEINALGHVFSDLYHYEVSIYAVPSHQSDRAFKRRVLDFVENDRQDTLLIFYYAGYAFLNPARNDSPVWKAYDAVSLSPFLYFAHSQNRNRTASSSTLPSSGIQSLLEEAGCDALLLYDSCHSADTAITPAHSSRDVTEVIAACGFESITPEVGEHSFTNALINVLVVSSEGPAFSIAELHGRVLAELKRGWTAAPKRDGYGMFIQNHFGQLVMEPERTTAPVYCNLTHERSRRNIILAPSSKDPLRQTFTASLDSASSTFMRQGMSEAIAYSPKSSINRVWPGQTTNPEIVIAVKLWDEVADGRHKPDTNSWMEWLRNAPSEAMEIEIDVKETNQPGDSEYDSGDGFNDFEIGSFAGRLS